MNQTTSTEHGTSAEPVPNYLLRYVAELERWRQESAAARAPRGCLTSRFPPPRVEQAQG